MDTLFPGINKNILFRRLLCNGMFHFDIEKIFNSKQFGEFMLKNNFPFDAFGKQLHFELTPFIRTRQNNVPRHMSVPHPLAYYELCKCLSENWDNISNSLMINRSDYCLTSLLIPSIHKKTERLISWRSYEKPRQKKKTERYLTVSKRELCKYKVDADIANFYPSIYSHSISWALVGKEMSKKFPEKTKWFNQIDVKSRQCKSAETNGIPIGPDTSNVISEFLLSVIDERLIKKGYSYFRYIDDYTCFCNSREEAEAFIKDLGVELMEFRLTLSDKKTKITKMPVPKEENWLRKLRCITVPDLVTERNIDDVISFLDEALEQSNAINDFRAFKYAFQVIRKKEYKDYYSYKTILLYLSNVVFLHPYMIDIFYLFVGKGFFKFGKLKGDLRIILLKILTGLIKENVEYKRTDIIVWSFCMAIEFEVDIEEAVLKKAKQIILDGDDPLSALMLFFYFSYKDMNVDDFFEILNKKNQESWWIFFYELLRIDWDRACNIIGEDDIKYKDFYQKLIKNKITFVKGPFHSFSTII